MYTTFEIPKKKGGVRKISAPVKELKSIQRKLAYVLNLVYKVKSSAYGFIPKKNIKDNAKKHVRKKIILNLDLKDFFNQVHFGRVRGMLMHEPYSIGQEAATVIAQLACFNGVLSQGSPSSPVITNMICSPLDTQLIRLAKKHGIVYTRYVDDITLSTFNDSFSETIIKGDVSNLIIGSELENILKKNSFSVNSDKVFLNNNVTRQEVTGLIVNRFPNVKREYIKNLRAILHNCCKKGIYETALEYIEKSHGKKKDIIKNSDNKEYVNNWFKCVLKGKINFIREIKGKNDYIFLKYAQQLNLLFNEEIFNLDFLDEFMYNVVILETTNTDNIVQGSGFFIKDIGLFTNYHVTENNEFYSVKTYKMEKLGIISKGLNEINSNIDIDYALYELKSSKVSGLELGDSKNIKVGDKIVVIGYPEYCDNDSPNIQTCNIISRTNFLGECLYTISGRIVHGSSGGVVLNMNHKVIGIIKAGVVTLNEANTSSKQGFIPIYLALEHLNKGV
nr:reverse transcriptase domain-containing protein [Clostridium cibarium]